MTQTSSTLNDLLENSANESGGRTALISEGKDGTSTTTYTELQQKVLAVAAAFHQRGIGKGDTVAIIHRNSPEFVIAYFGLMRLGAIAVPINFMVQKPEELHYMLEHSEVKGVVTQREFLRGLRQAKKTLPLCATLWVSDPKNEAPGEEPFWRFIESGTQQPAAPSPDVAASDVCSVLYTSGTTGVPKGVMLTHGNIVSNTEASIEAMHCNADDVAITILPMFHTFAWTCSVVLSIRLGIKNIIVASLTPPKNWLKLMGRHGVTLFAAVPQIYGVLSKQAVGLKGLILKWWFFRSVKVACSGAAPLAPQVLEDFRAAFGLSIIEGYGLTETSPVTTINPRKDPRSGSVGKTIPGVEVRIVGEDRQALPAGKEGEIEIRGPNVMKGYLKNSTATQDAINPEGWFKTGDIGAIEDDYLYIRDRIKDMIIVKGLKVFSAQVEAVMIEHPEVQEAAIIGLPDETGDETIKGFVVLKDGSTAEKADIMAFCRKKLDGYKRPRDIEILDELPKNALQKTLKRVLRQQELEKQQHAA
jgi:long-chain acyl-CoA synthetase